jgi:putative transposase
MVGFIDAHRETYGVEPICGVLPIAPSVYYELKAREREPAREPTRTRRDASLGEHVGRVWRENREVYGVRKVWKHLQREGPAVARCTVGRLLRQLGLRGAARGRKFKATTIADTSAARPADLVTRQFTATRPNQLWVADLMYVAAWRGFMYVAFVIDVLSRRIVGWRAASSLRNDLALEPLEQALYARPLGEAERLAEAGIEPSVGRYRRLVRQRAGGDRNRPVQDRGDSASWTLEGARGRRVRDARVGRVVQRQPPARLPGVRAPAEFEQAYHDRQTAPAELAVLN